MDNEQTVFIVDDDESIREGLSLLLESVGQPYELYCSAFDFLESWDQSKRGCLVLDIHMPRMTGLDLQMRLNEQNSTIPIIFITGHGDISMAVEAMHSGASDFIGKPFRDQDLLDRINQALDLDEKKRKSSMNWQRRMDRLLTLSKREKEVFHRVTIGEMNKTIARKLGISQRTVEVHRLQVMRKLGVRTLAELVRLKIELEVYNPMKHK